MIRVIAGLAAGAVVALACAGTPADEAPQLTAARRVLFVGNSLTYTNDLPATVAAIARDNGDSIHVAAAVGPDLALIDHLNGATSVRQLLNDSAWDAVVLQQGPTSSGGICRDSMILWTQMFQPLIKRAGGTSVTLMVWPAISQGDVWEGVHTSASLAASAVGGVLAPAGDAWHLALMAHPGLPLYGPDGFHPAPLGTFLTALVVYQKVTGRDPRTLHAAAFASGAPLAVGADTIAWLASAAFAADTARAALRGTPAAHVAVPGGGSC